MIPRIRLIANGLAAPLYLRFRLGEGGLLVVNASLAWKWYSLPLALGLTVMSALCLLSLYLFNDIIDARDDQHNPKKDRVLAETYVRERSTFLTLWVLMTGLCIVAGMWLDARAAMWVAAVSLLNVAYSLFCKKVPLLDVFWVGLWGAAYASIVTGAIDWILMVGAMTAVCHIYQISEDRDADMANAVATSATLSAPLLSMLQAASTAVLVATAWMISGNGAALTFAGLLAYWLLWYQRPRTGWIVAKAHFALVWAYLIVRG